MTCLVLLAGTWVWRRSTRALGRLRPPGGGETIPPGPGVSADSHPSQRTGNVSAACEGTGCQTEKGVVEWITREPLLSTESRTIPSGSVAGNYNIFREIFLRAAWANLPILSCIMANDRTPSGQILKKIEELSAASMTSYQQTAQPLSGSLMIVLSPMPARSSRRRSLINLAPGKRNFAEWPKWKRGILRPATRSCSCRANKRPSGAP